MNQYDASNNNTGSIFAKSVYTSGSPTDLKSVSIDVTKALLTTDNLKTSGTDKITYTVSHTLKDTTTIDTQTAYGSNTYKSITNASGTTISKYGVLDIDSKPIHFVDAVTTGVDTEHKIDNWYLSKLTATTANTNDVSSSNKLIDITTAGDYAISGFKLGDVLYFPSTPTATTLINSSTTDGEIKIDVTFNAVIAHITLTGISNDTDASVGNTDMTNFNTIFGFGTSPII